MSTPQDNQCCETWAPADCGARDPPDVKSPGQHQEHGPRYLRHVLAPPSSSTRARAPTDALRVTDGVPTGRVPLPDERVRHRRQAKGRCEAVVCNCGRHCATSGGANHLASVAIYLEPSLRPASAWRIASRPPSPTFGRKRKARLRDEGGCLRRWHGDHTFFTSLGHSASHCETCHSPTAPTPQAPATAREGTHR